MKVHAFEISAIDDCILNISNMTDKALREFENFIIMCNISIAKRKDKEHWYWVCLDIFVIRTAFKTW